MQCQDCEKLLLEGESNAALRSHLVACAACAEFAASLEEVDARLSNEYGQAHAPREFAATVLQRIERTAPLRRPSWVPDLLDLVGWAAVIALAITLWNSANIYLPVLFW
jgi:hypothetical protein